MPHQPVGSCLSSRPCTLRPVDGNSIASAPAIAAVLAAPEDCSRFANSPEHLAEDLPPADPGLYVGAADDGEIRNGSSGSAQGHRPTRHHRVVQRRNAGTPRRLGILITSPCSCIIGSRADQPRATSVDAMPVATGESVMSSFARQYVSPLGIPSTRTSSREGWAYLQLKVKVKLTLLHSG